MSIIITTKKKQDRLIISCMEQLERVNELSTWAAINPVIHSLKELRKNTWDVERVDHAIEWLEDIFSVAETSQPE